MVYYVIVVVLIMLKTSIPLIKTHSRKRYTGKDLSIGIAAVGS
tara:strand:- start:53155 stop:53283 length:129 start_codon:yes stop_codon:yes gene_type:complete